MNKWTLAGSTALAALIAGNAALADVTPEGVLADWKAMNSAYGMVTTTASETRDGDTLTVTGISMASDQDGNKTSIDIPSMTLKDQGDGTVAIMMTEDYTMTAGTKDAATGADTAFKLNFSNPDAQIVASGTDDAATYTFTAPTMAISVVEVDGVPAADKGVNASFTFSDLSGKYDVTGSDVRTLESTGAAKTLDIAVDTKDPNSGETVAIKAQMAGIETTSSMSMAKDADLAKVAEALKAGFGVDSKFNYGATTYSMDVGGGASTTKANGTIASGALNVTMNKDQMAYGGDLKGVDVALESSDLPVPGMNVKYDESTFNFAIPVSKSDVPAPFTVLTRVTGLTMSDSLWSLFDAGAVLPRDPLTLIVDTTGTVTLTADLMDEAAAGSQPDLNSVNVNEVKLTAAGAEVAASGALTFDNSDKVTFEGVGVPTGEIIVNASGINALLDNVVKMGLVPEDQIAGARMMMGLFAKPGEAPDTLTSLLEFKNKGFFANGTQLK